MYDTPRNITVDGCISKYPVQVQYCQGECGPSKHVVDYAHSTLAAKECRCCSAHVSHYADIILDCSNGTQHMHSIPILASCQCDVTVCPERHG